jgi:hypothetical protein
MTEQEAFMHSMVKDFSDMAGSFLLPFYVFCRGEEGGTYQWEVVRSDGAIVCGCTCEAVADEIAYALRAAAKRNPIEQVGAA